MSRTQALALLAWLVCGAGASNCPKTSAAVTKWISSDLGADLVDQCCADLYSYVKNGTNYKDAVNGIYNTAKEKLKNIDAFYGPGLRLMTELSNWKTVLAKAGARISRICKPYYTQKLLKHKPATAAALDATVAGWVVQKTVRRCMLGVRRAISSSDWNHILTELWTPIHFAHNGFRKP